jgi:hypothetical protein
LANQRLTTQALAAGTADYLIKQATESSPRINAT